MLKITIVILIVFVLFVVVRVLVVANINSETKNRKDCIVSEFEDFGLCSAPCGGGTQSRTRSIIQQPNSTGTPCPPLIETRICNTQECPVNCIVSEFGDFGVCSAPCGGGTQSRTRSIIQQPNSTGTPCPPLIETQECNNVPCPTIEFNQGDRPLIHDTKNAVFPVVSFTQIPLLTLGGEFEYKVLSGINYNFTYFNPTNNTVNLDIALDSKRNVLSSFELTPTGNDYLRSPDISISFTSLKDFYVGDTLLAILSGRENSYAEVSELFVSLSVVSP